MKAGFKKLSKNKKKQFIIVLCYRAFGIVFIYFSLGMLFYKSAEDMLIFLALILGMIFIVFMKSTIDTVSNIQKVMKELEKK